MKNVLTIGIVLVVAGALVAGWWIFGGDGGLEPRAPAGGASHEPAPATDGAARIGAPATERAHFDPSTYLREWIPGRGMPAPVVERPLGPDIPVLIGEIAVLTKGLDRVGANTPLMKEKIQRLIGLPLTDAEKDAIAEYFRKSDDPTFKFFMMIAFRYIGDQHFVDAVEEHYDVDPTAVAECLSWMTARSEAAVDAFGRLLDREADPLMRDNLLTRVAQQGAPAAEKLLLDTYRYPKSKIDQRLALAGLAKAGGIAGRQTLRGVIDADFAAAGYDDAGEQPDSESLKDLRAHAVIGLLTRGDPDDLDWLFQRYRTARPGDPIAGYVAEYLAVTQQPKLVGNVVQTMLERGALVPELLNYLALRGTPDHYDDVSRLVSLARTPEERAKVQSVLQQLH
jgi:hypothetical protein